MRRLPAYVFFDGVYTVWPIDQNAKGGPPLHALRVLRGFCRATTGRGQLCKFRARAARVTTAHSCCPFYALPVAGDSVMKTYDNNVFIYCMYVLLKTSIESAETKKVFI